MRNRARTKLAAVKSAAPDSPSHATIPAAAQEGRVSAVDADGVVHATLAGGAAVVARCPAHLDRAWLRAAARVAPVDAVFVRAAPSGTLIVWGLFPAPAHDSVVVDVRIRGREVKIDAESVDVGNEKARLRIEREGNVSLRGRDVTSHARRVNRIKGGSVRLN